MPIERGKDWGTPAPPGFVDAVATTDAEVRQIVENSWAKGTEIPPIGILGGDLWRALGAPVGGMQGSKVEKHGWFHSTPLRCK